MSKLTDAIIDNYITELRDSCHTQQIVIRDLKRELEDISDALKRLHIQYYQGCLMVNYNGGDWYIEFPLEEIEETIINLIKEHAAASPNKRAV